MGPGVGTAPAEAGHGGAGRVLQPDIAGDGDVGVAGGLTGGAAGEMPGDASGNLEAADLWLAYKERGDQTAREQLILRYLHLVKYVTGRLAIGLPAHVDSDDLYSYGIFGLINAIERFDHRRGIKFETYAITRIRGSILDGLRAMDWVPSSLRQRARELEEAYARVEHRLGRAATDEEVAAELGVTVEELQRLIQDLSRSQLVSLEEMWLSSDREEGEFTLKDVLRDVKADDPYAAAVVTETKEMLAQAIENLPEKERLVVTLYYYEGLTAKEISQIMKLSVSRISQLHSKAIFRLRGRLARMGRPGD